jgi:hypothetical protein
VCNRPASTTREGGKENQNQRGRRRRSKKTGAEEGEKHVKFLLKTTKNSKV